jgi:hypothetical protein
MSGCCFAAPPSLVRGASPGLRSSPGTPPSTCRVQRLLAHDSASSERSPSPAPSTAPRPGRIALHCDRHPARARLLAGDDNRLPGPDRPDHPVPRQAEEHGQGVGSMRAQLSLSDADHLTVIVYRGRAFRFWPGWRCAGYARKPRRFGAVTPDAAIQLARGR